MKTIEVKSCGECPFSDIDFEDGIDRCNLSIVVKGNIKIGFREELPVFKVHENCPLKTESVTVKLKE